MKLAAVILENFRGYNQSTRIEIDYLTALIGKNDAGKSTILEALEIFFNEGKPEKGDACVHSGKATIRISCTFVDLPTELILDAAAKTSLFAEHLLNEKGELEIVKEWDATVKNPKESVFAAAMHPTNTDASDLFALKNTELKSRLKRLAIDEATVNLTINGDMRHAIRAACEPLHLEKTLIPLDGKDDAKKVWDQIKPQLPDVCTFSFRPFKPGWR